mmetsp:Transcript_67443/g.133695  ORF Transcript_67443/g.133695 Transcript_67443/m.133695 type:complete len:211 (-) Transcript_67443:1123-1755(-)
MHRHTHARSHHHYHLACELTIAAAISSDLISHASDRGRAGLRLGWGAAGFGQCALERATELCQLLVSGGKVPGQRILALRVLLDHLAVLWIPCQDHIRDQHHLVRRWSVLKFLTALLVVEAFKDAVSDDTVLLAHHRQPASAAHDLAPDGLAIGGECDRCESVISRRQLASLVAASTRVQITISCCSVDARLQLEVTFTLKEHLAASCND